MQKKYKGIVNLKIGKAYSIVSKDYELIRHEETVNQIETNSIRRDVLVSTPRKGEAWQIIGYAGMAVKAMIKGHHVVGG